MTDQHLQRLVDEAFQERSPRQLLKANASYFNSKRQSGLSDAELCAAFLKATGFDLQTESFTRYVNEGLKPALAGDPLENAEDTVGRRRRRLPKKGKVATNGHSEEGLDGGEPPPIVGDDEPGKGSDLASVARYDAAQRGQASGGEPETGATDADLDESKRPPLESNGAMEASKRDSVIGLSDTISNRESPPACASRQVENLDDNAVCPDESEGSSLESTGAKEPGKEDSIIGSSDTISGLDLPGTNTSKQVENLGENAITAEAGSPAGGASGAVGAPPPGEAAADTRAHAAVAVAPISDGDQGSAAPRRTDGVGDGAPADPVSPTAEMTPDAAPPAVKISTEFGVQQVAARADEVPTGGGSGQRRSSPIGAPMSETLGAPAAGAFEMIFVPRPADDLRAHLNEAHLQGLLSFRQIDGAAVYSADAEQSGRFLKRHGIGKDELQRIVGSNRGSLRWM